MKRAFLIPAQAYIAFSSCYVLVSTRATKVLPGNACWTAAKST
jgi:hypothetical protein